MEALPRGHRARASKPSERSASRIETDLWPLAKEGAACRLIVRHSASPVGERLRTISMSRFGSRAVALVSSKKPCGISLSISFNRRRGIGAAHVRKCKMAGQYTSPIYYQPYLLQAIRRRLGPTSRKQPCCTKRFVRRHSRKSGKPGLAGDLPEGLTVPAQGFDCAI